VSFVDREKELGFLEERYRSGRAELLILYGGAPTPREYQRLGAGPEPQP